MKEETRLEKSQNALLDAVNDGTLAKGTCQACAVGNMIAAANGGEVYIHNNTAASNLKNGWATVFVTDAHGNQIKKPYNLTPEIKEEISKTGYTWEQLAEVEKAFESNTKINLRQYSNHTKEEIRKDQLNGLKAVVEVLAKFDEPGEEERYVEEFVHKFEQIPV